jgi:hypothetical protein
MTPELYTQVVISRDIPQEHVQRGDLAMFIDTLPDPNGGEEGAVLEIFNAVGESIRVLAVPISAIEPPRPEYVPAVRMIEPAA